MANPPSSINPIVRLNPNTGKFERIGGVVNPNQNPLTGGSGGGSNRGSGGGGGSSSNRNQSNANNIAEQNRVIAEAKRIADQQKAQVEAQRQAQIKIQQEQAQKVAEQQRQTQILAQVKAQNEIHMASDTQPRYTQSWFDSAKQAGATAWGYITGSSRETKAEKLARAKSITSTEGATIERPSVWENIIAPFQMTGKTVGETSSGVIKTGTIAPNENPTFTKQEIVDQQASKLKDKILIETYKVQNSYKQDLIDKQTDLQNRINEGTMDVNTANKILQETNQKLADKYNTQLQDNTSNAFTKLEKLKQENKYLGQSKAYTTLKEVPTVVDVGATVGLTAVNPVLGASYLGATGLVKGYNLQQKQAEGYKVSLGEKIDVGSRLAFGLGGLSGAGTRAIERAIVREQVSQLGSSPLTFNQIQMVKGNEGLVGFQAQQRYGGLTRNIQGAGKIVTNEKGSFILPIGEVSSRTSGELSWNILNSKSGSSLLQYEKSLFGSKGSSVTLSEETLKKANVPYVLNQDQLQGLSRYSFGISKSTLEPKASVSSLIGTSLRNKPIFISSTKLGGKPISSLGLSVSKEIAPDIQGNRRFFSVGASADTNLAVQQQKGVTTVIRQQEDKSSLFFGSGIKSESRGTGSLGGATSEVKTTSLGLSPEALTPIAKQSETALGGLFADTRTITRPRGALSDRASSIQIKEEKATKVEGLGLMQTSTLSNQVVDNQQMVEPKPTTKVGNSLLPQLDLGLVQPQLQQPRLEQPSFLAPQLAPRIIQTPKIGYTPSADFLPPAFNLGTIQTGGGQGRKPKRESLFGSTAYNPSLGAVLTKQKKKVTKKEASLLSNIKYTGLESRPLLEIVSDKKPRKKKSK